MISQYVFAVVAIAAASIIFVYIAVACRKAPRAARAMKWITAASLATGILMGLITDRFWKQQTDDGGLASFDIHANPCSLDDFPATSIRKAIVLTNQQHAGDPNWIDPWRWLRAARQIRIPKTINYVRFIFLRARV
jgi:hypothetical protein